MFAIEATEDLPLLRHLENEKMLRSLKLVLLALVLFAAPAFAASVAITGVGQTWSLDYNGIVDVGGVPTVQPGLSATIGYKVTGFYFDGTRTLLQMDIVVHNTTNASVYQNSTVTGIGFNTDPNIRRFGSGATGAYGYLSINTALPTGLGFMVEVCVSGRMNSCSGSAAGSTQTGQTSHAMVQLAFAGNLTNGAVITLDNFGIRYSDVISQSLGINGQKGLGVPVTPPIPEPAAAAVFGAGALLVAAALSRRRN